MNVTEHRNSFVRVVVCDTLRVDSFAAYAYSKNATTRLFASSLGYAYGPVSDKSMTSVTCTRFGSVFQKLQMFRYKSKANSGV